MATTIDTLIAEWAELRARRDDIDDRLDHVTAKLRDLGEGRHSGTLGTVTVSAPTQRFNPARAAEVLPPDIAATCTESVITAARAKEVLAPALYQACSVPVGAPRVSVKVS